MGTLREALDAALQAAEEQRRGLEARKVRGWWGWDEEGSQVGGEKEQLVQDEVWSMGVVVAVTPLLASGFW